MKLLSKIRVLDGFVLKVLMAALMLLDHLHYFIPGMPYWFHVASRVVAPIFVFLVAEGMFYSSNRVKYIQRMYIVGFAMLIVAVIFQFTLRTYPQNSIVMSLAMTAHMIFFIDRMRSANGNILLNSLALLVLLIAVSGFEGMYLCPIIGLTCYYLRRRPLIMCLVYLVTCSLYLLLVSLFFTAQVYMLFAVIFFLLYNGKRGLNNAFSKYFFYIFYPAHVWILFLVWYFVFR